MIHAVALDPFPIGIQFGVQIRASGIFHFNLFSIFDVLVQFFGELRDLSVIRAHAFFH